MSTNFMVAVTVTDLGDRDQEVARAILQVLDGVGIGGTLRLDRSPGRLAGRTNPPVNISRTAGDLFERLPADITAAVTALDPSANCTVETWFPDFDPEYVGSAQRVSAQWPAGGVRDLDIAPGAGLLAAAHDDGTARLWDLQTKALRHRMAATRDGGLIGIALSPDGGHLACADREGRLRVWSPVPDRADAPAARNVQLVGAYRGLVWNPAGTSLAAACVGRSVVVLPADPDEPEQWLQDAEDTWQSVHPVTWTPDGARLVTGTRTAASIRNATSGRVIRKLNLKSLRGAVSAVAISPDGAVLAIGLSRETGAGGLVSMWDGEGRTHLRDVVHQDGVIDQVLFSADGSRIAATAHCPAGPAFGERRSRSSVQVFSVPDSRLLASIEDDRFITAAAWTTDDEHLATGHRTDGSVVLRNPDTGEVLHELPA
ncbi:MAG: WD40 repeat domain-containing protein [Actinobacteria bacterium]|nr:WD40 repeat domain-containing protein [Actinomycetota bacterium]